MKVWARTIDGAIARRLNRQKDLLLEAHVVDPGEGVVAGDLADAIYVDEVRVELTDRARSTARLNPMDDA